MDYDSWNGSDCIALVPAMIDQWHLPRNVKAEVLGSRL